MYPLKTPIKYHPENLAKSANTFTTVYLGNYVAWDFDEGSGSHPGVDIIPMTPKASVFAVLDGEIIEATKKASEGNYVLIKHSNVGGKAGNEGVFYSCYLHLDSLSVTKGDRVQEGMEIGKSGNTGMSTGEHLHFQIDTWDAPFHPYWPFNTQDAKALWLGFFDAVNKGLWLDKAEKYTVNPLVFLDELEMQKGEEKSVTESEKISDTLPSNTVVVHEIELANNLSRATIFSDVPGNHTYAQAIRYLSEQGIAQGNGGKFFPENSVTRWELMKLGFKATKKMLSQDTASYFKDVPVGSEFLPYINTAREQKIVQWYPDGTFGVSKSVTRAEGLKILLWLLGVSLDEVTWPVYLDVSKTDWFAPQVLWSRENEVLGKIGSNFEPNKPLTRGEVAGIIHIASM